MTVHTSYSRAITFIQDHGHAAYLTPEGLLATSWAKDCRASRADDAWYQDSTVFPIADDNTVDHAAIRAWLGY